MNLNREEYSIVNEQLCLFFYVYVLICPDIDKTLYVFLLKSRLR